MSQPSWASGFNARVTHSPASGAKTRPKPYPASGAGKPPSTAPGFQVIREVGNFAVIDQGDNPVTSTSKAMLTVAYTADDISQVGNDKRKLKLGVYIGGRWQVYAWSQLADLGDADDLTGPGNVEVEIEGDLSDPPVSWGGGG